MNDTVFDYSNIEEYTSGENDGEVLLKFINLIKARDEHITALNLELDKKNNQIKHQIDIIKNQHLEIARLHQENAHYQFYPSHPKDKYVIDFGHRAWRDLTYRYCISSRQGQKICAWVLTKSASNTAAIKEFKKYLKDINYNLPIINV